MFYKRNHHHFLAGSLCVAGALIGGIAIGITAHKYAPEIRNRVQGMVSHLDMDLRSMDHDTSQPPM